MTVKFFITGTDTDVGKTYVSVALLRLFNSHKISTLGIKPLATGCNKINDKLFNDDALALQEASSIKLPYELINPFAFEPAIAPSIAASRVNQQISKSVMLDKLDLVLRHPADVYLIEGVGGWFVPLNDHERLSDVVEMLGIPVILVVAIKLGCLNHALLTVNAIAQAKVPLYGWVANCRDPSASAVDENIMTLTNMIPAPCLGILPYGVCAENNLNIQKFSLGVY